MPRNYKDPGPRPPASHAPPRPPGETYIPSPNQVPPLTPTDDNWYGNMAPVSASGRKLQQCVRRSTAVATLAVEVMLKTMSAERWNDDVAAKDQEKFDDWVDVDAEEFFAYAERFIDRISVLAADLNERIAVEEREARNVRGR